MASGGGRIDQVPRKGISLKQLLAFRQRNAQKLYGKTTKNVVEEIIKPETREHHCSFVELMELRGEECGRATRFVSHAWACPFLELVEALEHKCATSSTAVEWLWLDMFVVRQNQADQSKDKDSWFTTFSVVLCEIGSMWMMLMRFKDAIYLKRCWCLYEYYEALRGGLETVVILPQCEEEALIAYITSGQDILSVLSGVDVAAAQAESPDDQQRIHSLLAAIKGGHAAVDARITASLREWLVDVARARHRALALASASSSGLPRAPDAFPRMFGEMLFKMGLYEEAGEVLRASVAAGDMLSLCWLGNVYQRQGRAEEALGMHQRSLEYSMACFGADHPAVAGAYVNTAAVYGHLGREEEALDMYRRALAIYRRHYGDAHQHVGSSYLNIGISCSKLGRHEEALGHLGEARRVLSAALGPRHPYVIDTLSNIAATYSNMGRYSESVAMNQEVLGLYKATIGLDHEHVAITMEGIGLGYEAMGRGEEGVKMCREAYEICNRQLGANHSITQHIAQSLAHVTQQAAAQRAGGSGAGPAAGPYGGGGPIRSKCACMCM